MGGESEMRFIDGLKGLIVEQIEAVAEQDADRIAEWIKATGCAGQHEAIDWLDDLFDQAQRATDLARDGLVELGCPIGIHDAFDDWDEFESWAQQLQGRKPEDPTPKLMAIAARTLQLSAQRILDEGPSYSSVKDFVQARQRYEAIPALTAWLRVRIQGPKNRKYSPEQYRSAVNEALKDGASNLMEARTIAATKMGVSVRTVAIYTVQRPGPGRPPKNPKRK